MLRLIAAKPLKYGLGIAHGDSLVSLLIDNLMVAQMLLKKPAKLSQMKTWKKMVKQQFGNKITNLPDSLFSKKSVTVCTGTTKFPPPIIAALRSNSLWSTEKN